MRVAALYDIHANLPALDAALNEIVQIGVNHIVVGGDVVPGPFPNETFDRLMNIDVPITFICGNGDLATLAHVGAMDPEKIAYWGTATGAPLPESVRPAMRWTADQLKPQYLAFMRGWPKTIQMTIDGMGDVLFCHGTPRSETECFTRLTAEHLLTPLFKPLRVAYVVCGHTHMQFDRTIAGVRVINAGSVGMPYGRRGADWLLLGPGIELRHTNYDLARAAEQISRSAYPQAELFANATIMHPPTEEKMLTDLTSVSFP